MCRMLAAIAMATVSLLLPARAGASASARLVYVRSESAAVCPDETALRDAVHRRVGYDPFFPWAKVAVVVEVTTEGPAFVAQVQLVDARGVSLGARELRSGARGCPGLIDAAALAISIALELNAAALSPRDDAPEAPSAEAVHASARTDSDAPFAPPTGSDPSSASAAPDAPAPDEPTAISSSAPSASLPGPSRGPRVAVGLDVLSVFGAMPDVVPGLDLWVELRRGIGSVALEVRGDAPSELAFAGGEHASVLLVEASLAPCLHGGPLFACVVGSGGWLHASGSRVLVARSGGAPTLSGGARAGIELPVGRSFALRLSGDLRFEALRPSVSMDGAVWQLPLLSAMVGAGVSYHFP